MNIHEYLSLPQDEKPLDRMVTDGGLCGIFRTIACIGDSLASGEFESKSAAGDRGYHDMYDYSWGQYIARDTGSNVYNFSRGGMTAKEYCESFAESNGFWSKSLLSQAYIIALGVNDIINLHHPIGTIQDIRPDYNENPDTFAGNYGKIIQRIKEMQPEAHFFLMTMPKDEWGNGNREERTQHAEILESMAKFFKNTYVINLYKYAPYYDKEFKQRFYLGGHLNACGYIFTARMIESYIDYIIRHNPNAFRQVGFIGTGLSYEGADDLYQV